MCVLLCWDANDVKDVGNGSDVSKEKFYRKVRFRRHGHRLQHSSCTPVSSSSNFFSRLAVSPNPQTTPPLNLQPPPHPPPPPNTYNPPPNPSSFCGVLWQSQSNISSSNCYLIPWIYAPIHHAVTGSASVPVQGSDVTPVAQEERGGLGVAPRTRQVQCRELIHFRFNFTVRSIS